MIRKEPLFRAIANTLQAIENSIASGNREWTGKHRTRLESLIYNHMPSGSGIDARIVLSESESHSEKLVFSVPFHHMNEHGDYDGWTTYRVTVKSSLTSEFDLQISGRDRNDTKNYLYDVLDDALRAEVDPYESERAASVEGARP